MDSLYKAPRATLIEQPASVHGSPFFVTSIPKLCVLFICTFGFYIWYWGFKHWFSQRRCAGEKVLPIARAFFPVLYMHSLFGLINRRLQLQEQPYWRYSGAATGYVVLAVLAGILNLVFRNNLSPPPLVIALAAALLFGKLIPLVAIQRQANLASMDPKGETNSGFCGWNWAFIVMGGGGWLLVIAGYGMLALGLVPRG